MLCVTDCRTPKAILTALTQRGFEPVLMPPFPALPSPVASHPDMLMFICGGVLITHCDYYKLAKPRTDRICAAGNLRLVLTDEPIGKEYPSDILFNAAGCGSFIFADTAHISHHILEISEDSGKTFINIKQGYARCSICSVGDNAIITSDRGIAQTARSHGIDVLLIRSGHIRLDGYNTGFIGGASGRSCDKVYFCGSLDSHPDSLSIKAFCSTHYRDVVSLGIGELFDAGTLFFI